MVDQNCEKSMFTCLITSNDKDFVITKYKKPQLIPKPQRVFP